MHAVRNADLMRSSCPMLYSPPPNSSSFGCSKSGAVGVRCGLKVALYSDTAFSLR